MFSIRILPTSQTGPSGEGLGEIRIGDFIERFACHCPTGSLEDMESSWRTELHRLVAGELAVALIHDPRFA
jgi:hypothetical protein